MIFFDTETCGLYGPTVLIQWARDDGDIDLWDVWLEPVEDTMSLIEEFCYEDDGVCGFNLAFDWFHLCQTYTTMALLKDKKGKPIDMIEEYAIAEKKARDGQCLKPQKAMDLMLHARKTKYQSTMDRNDIRIKRVPTMLANELATELTKLIPLPDVYFARYTDKKKRWTVQDIKDDLGDIIPEFKDITLKFMPSSALKALAQDALGIDTEKILMFADVEIHKAFRPVELGYAPFALAIGTPEDWKGTWPQVIERHVSHWSYNSLAREYAEDDVKYTRALHIYFDSPEAGDFDSELACMVGTNRWRGFKIDVEGIKKLKKVSLRTVYDMKLKFNFESPDICRRYLEQVMGEPEKAVLRQNGKISTKAIILESIIKWTEETVCTECDGLGCNKCGGDGLISSGVRHPAALRAEELLSARHAKKELENYDKLLIAGRFHASFKVTGTLSNRMSGGDGLNAQGIKRAKEVRSQFPLAFPPMVLGAGDFSGFEVTIADAVFGDPKLHEEILSGKKIHSLFGICLFPEKSYDEITATKGATNPEDDLYTRAKNGVFAMLYGGEAYTLINRVGISAERADEAYGIWLNKYPIWGEKRKRYADMFCSMRQPNGLGTKVEWHEPSDYIESLFGFRRYFTLENQICKALFGLAENPPEEWLKLKGKVVRRDREQTVVNAVRTALFAAAFALQSSNMRAAGNHVIQSTGAEATKKLQIALWDLQPRGINDWRIQLLNVHDEVDAPMIPSIMGQAKEIVDNFVESLKPLIPLVEMEWNTQAKTWAD